MFRRTAKRKTPALQAGSMADIAFLLLIFFLVTTTLLQDQGLLVKLPPYADTYPTEPLPDRNVLSVRLNAADELLVEKEHLPMEQLTRQLITFVRNPEQRPDLAERPARAVVSLQCDRSTSYEAYLQVYNQLKAGYRTMREAEAQHLFQQPLEQLSLAQKRDVFRRIPMIISEAEPADFAPNALTGN